MAPKEKFREDFLTVLNSSVAAEREGCAKLIEKLVELGVNKRQFARLIRERPQFKLPPIALEFK